jgi:hypothetical protein
MPRFAQRGGETRSAAFDGLAVHPEIDAPVAMQVAVLVRRSLEPGDALRAARASAPATATSRRDHVVELVELPVQHSGLQLRHAPVGREEEVIGMGLAVGPGLVDVEPHTARQLGVAGGHGAAFAAAMCLPCWNE